jgi:hypothetical protein
MYCMRRKDSSMTTRETTMQITVAPVLNANTG